MLACFLSMVLLGTARLAIIGYTQAQADGVTFIATHAMARNSGSSTSSAKSLAQNVFGNIARSNMTTGRTTSQAYADYEPSMTKFDLVPGMHTTFNVRSHYVEPQLTSIAASGNVNVSVPLVTLSNYVNGTIPNVSSNGNNGSYQFYVAQYTDQSTVSDSDSYGRYGEWYAHYSTYVSLLSDLPSNYTVAQTQSQMTGSSGTCLESSDSYDSSDAYSGCYTENNGYNMSAQVASDEQTIYGWDSTNPGQSSSGSIPASELP